MSAVPAAAPGTPDARTPEAPGGAVRTGLLIGGRWRPGEDSATFPVLDPASGRLLAEVSAASANDVASAVHAAHAARSGWAGMAPRERGRLLRRVADLIRRDSGSLAHTEALDTGKPLRQARVDVEVAAGYFEFYGGLADKIYGETIPLDGSGFALTFREPMGVTGHIIPWNYPIAIGARTVAPALAAGNTCVLKPAEEAPLNALALGALIGEAGLPDGTVNVIPGPGESTGAALTAARDIDHLSFTGGVDTGRAVMTAAAAHVRPVMLELGGKSPSLVFADADLERALPVIANALIQNAGQTCSACTRVIVHRSRAAEFVDRFAGILDGVTIGRGVDDRDLGPLISSAQQSRVRDYLNVAAGEGCTVHSGATPAPASGFFVPPTMLTQVTPSMRVAQEEIFGPVLSVIEVDSEAEALEVADATPFGLVAAVWTRDVDRALRAARALRCGQVFVNSYGAGGGIDLPFGGYKRSGFGREKGVEAVREYTQIKTVTFSVRGES